MKLKIQFKNKDIIGMWALCFNNHATGIRLSSEFLYDLKDENDSLVINKPLIDMLSTEILQMMNKKVLNNLIKEAIEDLVQRGNFYANRG